MKKNQVLYLFHGPRGFTFSDTLDKTEVLDNAKAFLYLNGRAFIDKAYGAD
ncbi:hypothetical protein SAMN05443144_106185 [Fodinibius roseus]|uniref:Uncharacterized protein n=1 Tax=Fodinibius roseus TaxID=1194090 RepID=A0A1M4ZZS1_9BACT|nr:hypothetical protein SAMN05443144_106185 [Fodinibius roseus]